MLQWPRPLIVCGPTAYQARAGEVALDLWSVRSSSTVLPRWPDVETLAVDRAVPRPDPRVAALHSAASPTALLGLWQQAWQAAADEKGKGKRLDLSLGLAAAQQLLDAWQLEAAGQVIDQFGQRVAPSPLLNQSLERLAQRQRWHWLVVQLDLAVKCRQWPAAKAAVQAALAQADRLETLTGELPEALSELASGLGRMADLCRDQGDKEGARALYQRGLAVATSALRQSPLAREFQQLVVVAQAQVATVAALNAPSP